MIFRRLRRAVALGIVLGWGLVRFSWLRLRGPVSLERRARWVSETSLSVLHSLGIHYRVEGAAARRGLLVANHLSYLDILILSAAAPCFFVAKAEIGRWPFFGTAARIGGTIFVDRGNLQSAISVAEQMGERMRLSIEVPVLMFPEGTSTDGVCVHRFHSRLFEPAIAQKAPISVAAIRYVSGDGTPERELCWYGDETFFHHLWKVLAVGDFRAELHFGSTCIYADRRLAADRTREEIESLRTVK